MPFGGLPQGDPIDRIYWVLAGNLSVFTQDWGSDQMSISEVLAPGHHFGEQAMLADLQSPPLWACDIIARNHCVLAYFGKFAVCARGVMPAFE